MSRAPFVPSRQQHFQLPGPINGPILIPIPFIIPTRRQMDIDPDKIIRRRVIYLETIQRGWKPKLTTRFCRRRWMMNGTAREALSTLRLHPISITTDQIRQVRLPAPYPKAISFQNPPMYSTSSSSNNPNSSSILL